MLSMLDDLSRKRRCSHWRAGCSESEHVRFGGGPLEKGLHCRYLASGLPDPKKNGKKRPLGMPPWSDKLVAEVVRMLLDAYYDGGFSDRSHG
ncbi:MAG: hypothetical protein QOE37_2223, partial [Microbacteriaceae bacterium]|nr:hypothetical protein [Microbacteriaceae bacterium]